MPEQYRHYDDEPRRSGRRSWTDRAMDEGRAFFGDDDGRARRTQDEREGQYEDRSWRDQGDGGGNRSARLGPWPDRGYRNRFPEQGDRGWGSERYGTSDERDWNRGPAQGGAMWESYDSGAGDRDYGQGQRETRYGQSGRYGQGYGSMNQGSQGYGGQDYGARGGYSQQGGDWKQPGQSYAGRGPKGYQRSDDRIREEISDRLTEDHHIDASEITVQVQQGDVTLTGTVSSREQKRRAEDLAERISGVKDVTNNLRVNRQESSNLSIAGSGSGDNNTPKQSLSGLTSQGVGRETTGSAKSQRPSTGSSE